MDARLTQAQVDALKALSEAESAYNIAAVHSDYHLQMHKLRQLNDEKSVELAEMLKAAYEDMLQANETYLQLTRLEEMNAE